MIILDIWPNENETETENKNDLCPKTCRILRLSYLQRK